MALTAQKWILLEIMMLSFYLVGIEGRNDSGICMYPDLPTLQVGDKCFWLSGGGNMSDHQAECEIYMGTVFTYDTDEQLDNILRAFNMENASGVYIGVILNNKNGTYYYDTLSKPGTVPSMVSSLGNLIEIGTQNKRCIVLEKRQIYQEFCNISTTSSICERERTAPCPCNISMSTSIATTQATRATNLVPTKAPTTTESGIHSLYQTYQTPTHPQKSTSHLSTLTPSMRSTDLSASVVTTGVLGFNNLSTRAASGPLRFIERIINDNDSFAMILSHVLGQSINQSATIGTDNSITTGDVSSGDSSEYSTEEYGTPSSTVIVSTQSVLPSTTEDPQDVVKALLDQLGRLFPPFGNTTNSIHVPEQDTSSSGKDPSEIIYADSTNVTYVPIKVTEDTSYECIKLSVGIFSETKAIRVSTIVHRTLHETFVPKQIGNRSASIGSKVLSVSLQHVGDTGTRTANINVNDAIILILRTEIELDRTEHSRLCSYWNVANKSWATDGCRQVFKNQSHTTCSCDHLTNFAVLVLYTSENQISEKNRQVLVILSTVGCSISIACLGTTLVIYVYLRVLNNEKILIHANLALALLLAQLVFVTSDDANKSEVVCKVVASLLHFLFMASFTWMMVEGIALYLCCTKGIFNYKDMRIKYFLLGWGLPAVIVSVSVGAQFPNYGEGPEKSCWLSNHNGLIWAFLGPMLIIVLMNLFVLGVVIRVFLTLKTNSEKTQAARIRGSLRAMLTLLPLLGLTWLLSLLVPFSVVFHYIFVICSTMQGMLVFFLHCICNDEIQKKFSAKKKALWSSSGRSGSVTDIGYSVRRKTGRMPTRNDVHLSPKEKVHASCCLKRTLQTMEGKLLDETFENDFTVQPYMYEPMPANNEEEAESSDSESDEINSEQHGNDEVNKRLAAHIDTLPRI
ncbi:hypothetical protein ACJMK2_018212 [Sinanodonta woodiana]|uniref:Uncharacterized protein n=1 Tax=Sinanodonta woodiana TaxID=1069815 RepID=A0ABD3UGN0_SINWO